MALVHVIKFGSNECTVSGKNINEIKEELRKEVKDSIDIDELIKNRVISQREGEKGILKSLCVSYWQNQKDFYKSKKAFELNDEIEKNNKNSIYFDKESFDILVEGFKKVEQKPANWFTYKELIEQLYDNNPVNLEDII